MIKLSLKNETEASQVLSILEMVQWRHLFELWKQVFHHRLKIFKFFLSLFQTFANELEHWLLEIELQLWTVLSLEGMESLFESGIDLLYFIGLGTKRISPIKESFLMLVKLIEMGSKHPDFLVLFLDLFLCFLQFWEHFIV